MMNQKKNLNTKECRMEGLDYVIHMTNSGEKMTISPLIVFQSSPKTLHKGMVK